MLLTALSLMAPATPAPGKTARVGNVFARTGALAGTLGPVAPPVVGCSGYTFAPPGATKCVDMWSATNAPGANIELGGPVFGIGDLGDFTFECWIKLFDATASPWEVIISFPVPGVAFPVQWDACSAALSALYCMTVFPQAYRSPVLWPPGVSGGPSPLMTYATWNHFAVVGDLSAQRARFYMNGVARPNGIDEQFYIGGPTIGGGAPVIGNIVSSGYWPFGASVLRGRMSDLRIWNKVRTANDIQCSYNHRLLGSEAGLIGYWPMDEGTGTQIGDLSPNDNDGTFSSGTDITWANDAPTFT